MSVIFGTIQSDDSAHNQELVSVMGFCDNRSVSTALTSVTSVIWASAPQGATVSNRNTQPPRQWNGIRGRQCQNREASRS